MRYQQQKGVITALFLLISWLMALPAAAASPITINLSDAEQTWLEAHPKIRIGIMNAWPPMDYVDSSGRPQGIGVKFINSINKRLGNRIEIVPGPWKDTYEAVKEQRLEALMDITPRPDREPFFNFTNPYIKVPHVIFTHKDEPYKASLADLTGKTVGVEQGFFIVKVLKANYPQVTVKEFTTTSDALDALSKREVDAYVGNRAVAMYIIESELITNLRAQGKISETVSTNAIGVRKDWPILRDILQKALDDIPQPERSRIITPFPRVNGQSIIAERFARGLSHEEIAWLDEHPRIHVGAMNAWPPLNFVSENGTPRGIGADYINAINQRLGGRLVIEPAPFKESYNKVKNRELDALMDITPKKEREAFFEFTRSYLTIPHIYVGRKDGPYFDSAQDLFGRTIALEEGYYNARLFRNNYPQVTVREYPSTAEALGAVSRGEADAYAGNRAVVMYLLEKELLYNLMVQGRMEKPSVRLNIGVRKDWSILAGILDRALADISREEVRRIHKTWVGELKVVELGLTDAERAWLANHPVIRVSSEADYPPFDYRIAGKPAGYSVELVELLAERLGIELEYVQDTWSNMLKMAEKGELDLLHTIFKYPPEREDYLEFTRPYKEVINVIVTRDDMAAIHQVDDLKAHRVAVVTGDSLVDVVKQVVPERQLVYFDSFQEALKSVAAGKTDATLTELPTATHHIRSLFLTNLAITGKTEALGGRDQRYRLAVRKDWAILAGILDKALNSITVGEFQRLDEKWLAQVQMGSKPMARVALSVEERAWVKAHPVVRIAFDESYPPYSFRSARGDYVGIAVDFANELASRAGIKLEAYPEGEWKKLYAAAQQREVDVIATLVKREERKEWFDFTSPYISLAQYVITRKEDVQAINQPEQLAGKRVALVEGYSMTKVILEEIADVRPYYVANLDEALEAVSAGKADAAIGAIGMAHHLITKAGLPNLGFATLYSKGQSEQRFGVRKDWPELAGILDKALASMSDEEIMAVFGNWTRPEIAVAEAELAKKLIELTAEERAWLSAHPVIRVSNELDWPPYDFSAAGQPTGFAIDYLRLLSDKVGVQFEFVTASWSDLMDKFKQGEIDLIHPLHFSKEREAFMHFTKPFFTLSSVAAVRQGDEHISSLKQLYGKTLASGKGWTMTKYIQEQHPQIKLLIVNNALEGMKAVQFGQADAWIDAYASSRYLIDTHHMSNLKLGGEIADAGDFQFVPHYIGVRKDWPILHNIVQKALGAVSPEELQQLNEKWRVFAEKVQRLKLTTEEQEWLAANPVLSLGYDIDWPPVEFVDKEGTYKGMSADYMALIAESLGVTLEPAAPQSWQATIDAAKTGELDLLSAVAPTPQRDEYLRFTKTYLSFPIVIVTDQRVSYISDIKELKERKVTVVSGYASHDILVNNHPEIALQPVKDIIEGLRAVQSGEAYAFVGSLASTSHIMGREGIAGLKVSGETPYSFDLSIGVRKDQPILSGLMQKALDAIPEEKRIEIYNRWIAVTYERGFDYSLLWKILVPIVILVILLVLWNWQLNRVVNRKTTQLRESEAQYRALVESVQSYYFFYAHDTDGVFTYLSPSIEIVLGYKPEDFLMHYSEYLTDDPVNEAVERHSQLAIQGEEQPPYELEIFHKDGSRFWLEVKETPVFDRRGRVVAVEGVARNITENKQAEIELATYREHLEVLVDERTVELRQSEERFRTLVSNSPGAVYRSQLDADWTIDFISDAMQEISGYPVSDFIHNKVRSYASIIYSEDVQLVDDKVHAAVEQQSLYELTYRIVRADGEIRWVDERGSAIFSDTGDVEWLEGIIIDVSDRISAEEKVKQYMGELESFNRLALGREKQIISLKQDINSLLVKLGQERRFKSV
ncbi:MAG: transporter substrate-binding domain-containing protein [Candidatus Sedimenticola sp. (ex Thyasira tokunagai)]